MDIELLDLGYSYEGEKIFDNLSFSFPDRSITSILGPSGCGKSTLLNLIGGLLPLSQGHIFYQGQEELSFPIGYMTQRDLLIPFKTVWENLLLMCQLQRMHTQVKERIQSLLEQFQLEKIRDLYPRQLSGGLRQRVSLLRQLLVKTPLLLLDEPFVALDFVTKQYFERILLPIIKEEAQTVILVTHDVSEAISISDRIILLGQSPTTFVQLFSDVQKSNPENIRREIIDKLRQTYVS